MGHPASFCKPLLLGFWDRLRWYGERVVGDSCFAKGEWKLLLGLAVAVVGADNALDEVVADYVDVFEVAEADAFYAVEDVEGFEEAGFFGVGQVDLREVACDYCLRVVAEAGDEHLHLLGGGVLGLVHDDEGVVESAAAHEGEWSDFDDVRLEHLVDFDVVKQVVECVVERTKVGIDLFLERAGEEAEALASFDRWAHEDDAGDALGHEGADRHRNGEVGFTGSGG